MDSQKNKKRLIKNPILVSFLVIIILIIVIMLGTIWYSIIDIFEQRNDTYEEQYIDNVLNTVNITVSHINEYYRNLIIEYWINDYLEYPKRNYYDSITGAIDSSDRTGLYNYMQVKTNFKSSIMAQQHLNHYLFSLYYYDKVNEVFYVSNGVQYDRVDFPDVACIGYTQKISPNAKGVEVFDVRVEKEINYSRKIISIIYYDIVQESNYLIVNLDLAKMADDILGNVYSKDMGDIYVVSAKGDIILSSNEDSIGENLSNIPDRELYIRRNADHLTVSSVDEEDTIRTKQISPFNWYVVTITDNKALNADINKIYRNILITSIIVLLLAVFIIIYATKRAFSPMLEIITHIDQSDPDLINDDPFRRVIEFVDKSTEQKNQIQERLELSQPLYQQKVLEWLLFGQKLKPENRENIFRVMNIKSVHEQVIVISAMADWTDKVFQHEITAIITSAIKCELLSVNQYLVFLCHDSIENMNNIEIILKEKLTDINKNLLVGIGSIVEINNLLTSYENSVFTINYLKTKSMTGVMLFTNTLENFIVVDMINNGKLTALEHALKLKDYIQIKTIYNGIMESIKAKTSMLSVLQIRYEILKLNMSVLSTLYEYISDQKILVLYYEIIDKSNNSDVESMQKLLNEYIDLMIDSETEEYFVHDDYVTEAKRIINRDYSCDISLDEIAHKLGITQEYLSKLFKERQKTGFIEYLTKVRMEKAKNLLTSTDYKISQISSMVGYQTPDYFSRVFKKYFGVTPKKYKYQTIFTRK